MERTDEEWVQKHQQQSYLCCQHNFNRENWNKSKRTEAKTRLWRERSLDLSLTFQDDSFCSLFLPHIKDLLVKKINKKFFFKIRPVPTLCLCIMCCRSGRSVMGTQEKITQPETGAAMKWRRPVTPIRSRPATTDVSSPADLLGLFTQLKKKNLLRIKSA